MKKSYRKAISVLLACGMLFLTACSPADYAQIEQMMAESAGNQNQTEPEEVTGRITYRYGQGFHRTSNFKQLFKVLS